MWAWLCLACVVALPTPVVQTESGEVQGFVETHRGVEINCFIGIPYAEPPLKNLRFRPPQKHPNWSGVKNVSTFTPICPQMPNKAYTFPPHYKVDEDCLTMHIWAPATKSEKPRAVMAWIHGGGFWNGGNVELRERGGELAAIGDVITVFFNYRLGILGFLAIPPMFEEGKDIGNWGLKDQVFALRWIHENIANFGGDPNRVTIFGESAGGSAMGIHAMLPASRPYINSIIVESGAPVIELLNMNLSLALGIAVSEEAGCFDRARVMECMRSKGWGDLIMELPPCIFPVIDGDFLPENPYNSMVGGRFAKVPLMIGDVSQEFWNLAGSIFFLGPVSQGEYKGLIELLVGKHLGDKVLNYYPCAAYNASDCRAALGEIISDFVLSCETDMVGEAYANHSLPVWAFEFSHHASWIKIPFNWQFWNGAPHASELEFVWSTTQIHNSTPAEIELATTMSTYWTNFAKYGDPNGEANGTSSLPHWPQYTKAANYPRMNFWNNENQTLNTMYNERQCEMWRPIYAFWANSTWLPFPDESPLHPQNWYKWRK